MAQKSYKLTKADVVEILASVIGELQTVGFRVGTKNAPQKEGRGAGLLIYVEGVNTDNESLILINEVTQGTPT